MTQPPPLLREVRADTTDAQIARATKEELVCALYQGRLAVLRDHRRRHRTREQLRTEARDLRDRLRDAGKAQPRTSTPPRPALAKILGYEPPPPPQRMTLEP